MTARDTSPNSEVSHHDVARGAGSALLSRAGALVEVVAQPAYLWMFGLSTYGLYTVLWSAVNLIENAADFGMTSALQRVVPQARSEQDACAAVRYALLLGVLPCLLIAGIATVFAPQLAGVFNAGSADRPLLATGIALFSWALPLWAFIEVGTSAVRARRGFGPEIRLRLLWEQLIRFGLAVPLWLAGVDTLGLLIAHLLSLAVTAIFCVRLIGRYYDLRTLLNARGGPGVFRTTLLAGLSVFPSNIVGRIFGDAPPIILNLWLPGAAGAAAAGLYGIARKLSSLVQMIRVALSYVVGPLASAVAAHDRSRIGPLYAFATRLATVLALPVATGVIAGAWRYHGLFGANGRLAALLLVPLVAARLVDAVTGPGGAVQQVSSGRAHPIISSLTGLAVATHLALTLMPGWGAAGMAAAVGTGLATSSLTTVLQLRIHDGLNPFHSPYLRVFGIAAAICAGAAALIVGTPLLPLPFDAAAMTAVLLAALWLCVRFALPPADRETTGTAGRRLRLHGTR